MVGDRVATDIIGARAAGIKSVLVKTGEFKESDFERRCPAGFLSLTLSERSKSFFSVLQTATSVKISDHQQSWGYEDGPWKGPGPPLLVAADF